MCVRACVFVIAFKYSNIYIHQSNIFSYRMARCIYRERNDKRGVKGTGREKGTE